jgi:prepilin-type N-terminal cleavage/methylation domain-containing protein
MNKGFTLIETLVVIAIISALSTFGMIRISAFQKEAKLDSVANEIISTLKVARSKSELGEIPSGMVLSDFFEGGLPSYGVRLTSDRYEVFVRYIKDDAPTIIVEESVGNPNLVSNEITLTPSKILYSRISGKTTGSEIEIKYKGDLENKVMIDSLGYFYIQ